MLTSTERGQVNAIMRRLSQRHAQIEADPNLSREGKRALRAREQLAAEQAHRQIIEASDARHRSATRDAYYKAFGMKATTADGIMADRDARQYAAGLKTPQDALRELAQAELRGDTSLARAIAERGWTLRSEPGGQWDQVVREYATADPSRNATLGALSELTDTDPMADRLYRHLTRPDDLQRGSIEALAAQADQSSAQVAAG